MANRAIYETRDKQLIRLDDIQHIYGRYNEALKDGYQTITILYKDGTKVTIPASEYDNLYRCWEARKKRFDVKILIDNGHGNNTAGKCSPDKRFKEYAWNREIAAQVVYGLRKLGYDAELLVPELYDVSLLERVHRVNVKCQSLGKENVILVSVHGNAAGNGDWMKARGWSCFTTEGKTKSDTLAEHLYDAAERIFVGHKIRTDKSDGDRDWEKAFYICRKSLCPAVLTESFFYDNKEDLEYMESEEGKEAVVRCHVEGIKSYVDSLNK